MTSKKKIHFIGVGTFFLLLGFFTLKPVPIPHERDCLSIKGLVAEIKESGTKDVSFKLQGIDKIFYINRGLERGLDLETLRASITNSEVLIKYPKYFTFLDPTNSIRHVFKIEFNGQTIFSELTN